MLPKIQPEHSGELEGPRQAHSVDRINAALARAPADADHGEVARGLRVDGVDISPRGERLVQGERRGDPPSPTDSSASKTSGGAFDDGQAQLETAAHGAELAPEDLRRLRELERSDRVVRAQENVQRTVGQGLVRGQPTFEFEVGPDGKRYAVRGETRIELPQGGTPQDTVRDARRALRAALAPKDVSGADRSLALRAAGIEARARAEIHRDERLQTSEEYEAQRRQAAEAYERSQLELGTSDPGL